MTKRQWSERERFIALCVDNYAVGTFDTLTHRDHARRAATLLMRHAKTHHRIQGDRCNIEFTPAMERREELLERRIKELAESIGLHADCDGDPRGYTVKVHFPGGKHWNTWGGQETGYGVPNGS